MVTYVSHEEVHFLVGKLLSRTASPAKSKRKTPVSGDSLQVWK